MRNKIVLIGQFPPVVTGQSLVTEYIYKKLLFWGISCVKLPLNQIDGSKLINYFLFYYQFIKICSKKDLIIYLSPARSNLGYWRNFIIISYSRFLNNRIVLHYHCGDYDEFLSSSNFFVKKTCVYIFKKVSYHIFLSKRLLPNFEKLNLNQSKIVYIPNSITHKQSKLIKGFSSECIEYKIVFMSNLLPSKGYMVLLNAMEILINKFGIRNIRCDFYGKFISEDSRSEKELINEFNLFISNNNLTNFVKHGGVIKGEEKQKVLSASQIFVLPTSYPVEAQPLSILEALSNNLLVIASEFRAIPDMIVDGVSGVLLKSNSSDHLAVKIIEIVNNSEEYSRIAVNGRKYFEENFSNKVFDNNLKDFLHKINLYERF